MNTEKSTPKRGRPKKFVDLELVEKLAHIQCTYGEIASTLGVSIDTLTRNANFAVVYKRGAESGRKSLRRMQFESANKGNIVMQIWLGKQYLGQSDHLTNEVRQLPSLRGLTSRELNELLTEYANAYPDLFAHVSTLDAKYSVVKSRPAALLSAHDGEKAD